MDFKIKDETRFESNFELFFRKYSFRIHNGKYTIFDVYTNQILFKDLTEITIDGQEIGNIYVLNGLLSNILFRRDCECNDQYAPIRDDIFDFSFDYTFQ